MSVKTFSQRVVACAIAIPFGKVTTYGLIARAAGGGALGARSVTSILSKAAKSGEKNIPFHRIVYSNGKIWTNPEYNNVRIKLYKKEGIIIDNKGRITNFKDILHEFC